MVEIALVDLLARYKTLDIDGVVAFDLDRLELFRLDLDIFALAQLVAASLLVALDDVAGFGIDHLLLQPVAGFAVDQVKPGLLGRGRGGIEHDRAGDERQFQRPFPVGAGGHSNLQCFQGVSEPQPMLGVLVPGGTLAMIGLDTRARMQDRPC